jgi:hypothetical protein
VETLLEIAVERQVDIVLIQELTTGRGSTASHDSFRWLKGEDRDVAKYWVAINKVASGVRVTERKEGTEECGGNYI